jgi:hypothetical protein
MNRLTTISFILIGVSATAQERLGIANSNYAGTNGVLLNPSSMVDSWTYIDINLAGASAFVHNNYYYLPETNLLRLAKNKELANNPMDKYTKTLKNGFFQGSVSGPAVTMVLGDHAIGLNTNIRSYANVNKVPYHLAKFTKEGFTFSELQNQDFSVKNASFNAMSWGEVGLSYGKILKKQDRDLISAGITVKKLFGITQGSLLIEELDYNVNDSAQMMVSNYKGQLAYTEPAFNSGKGWGFDLGFTYKKMKEDVSGYIPHSKAYDCECMDYQYKIGASILDIGRIKFTQNALLTSYENGQGQFDTDFQAINEIDDIIEPFDELANDGGTSSSTYTYKAKLPTAASVQVDYNLGKFFYVNGTMVQRLTSAKKLGVVRPNLTTVSLRYERKRFEVAVPVSLYEYRYPMMGVMVRLNSVIIGTDNLGPYLFKTDIYRADIYVSVKYSIFKSGKCKEKGSRTGSSRKGVNRMGKNRSSKTSNREFRKNLKSCPAFN